ncbi:MAG: molybdopterin-guanine dinucleotide biosynthesis protein B [Rhodobacter sp.]|nr:molybdopterin-guanine dinucleotide biosynthesis protein B [Rhodobacter sp.]
MELFGIVGWKNSGKTGLMERLVAEITGRGITVSTVKHAHHAFDVDQPGKDSYRHRTAGAQEVLLSSGRRWALMHELRGATEPPLSELLQLLSPVDLVLIEGYKRDGHPKIEAHRAATGQPLIAPGDPTILAVASDSAHPGLGCPVLDLDATARIADLILQATGLMRLPKTG